MYGATFIDASPTPKPLGKRPRIIIALLGAKPSNPNMTATSRAGDRADIELVKTSRDRSSNAW